MPMGIAEALKRSQEGYGSIPEDLTHIPVLGAAGEGWREIKEAVTQGSVANKNVKAAPEGALLKAANITTAAANKYKINPNMLWGIYGVETAFGKDIKNSTTGAVGAFQFEPATAKEYGYPLQNVTVEQNPKVFQEQAEAAARYLVAHGGVKNIRAAVAAYNPGEASYLSKVEKAATNLPKQFAGNAEESSIQAGAEQTPVEGLWPKFGELGVNLILVLVGAALLVYGVMVMVRPREKALQAPIKGRAINI